MPLLLLLLLLLLPGTKAKLGLSKPEEQVVWVMLKEVLTCYKVHGLPLPLDLTYEDERAATEISGWLWGTLFSDKVVSRLAAGRFLGELLRDIDSSLLPASASAGASAGAGAGAGVTNADTDTETVFYKGSESHAPVPSNPSASHKKILIYSGHDSTLVPLMCALGLYDNQWPPYASYLTLEIIRKSGDSGDGGDGGDDGMYVRALFNDQVRPLFRANNTYDTDEAEAPSAALLPYAEFKDQLQGLLITEDEYSAACVKH